MVFLGLRSKGHRRVGRGLKPQAARCPAAGALTAGAGGCGLLLVLRGPRPRPLSGLPVPPAVPGGLGSYMHRAVPVSVIAKWCVRACTCACVCVLVCERRMQISHFLQGHQSLD